MSFGLIYHFKGGRITNWIRLLSFQQICIVLRIYAITIMRELITFSKFDISFF